MFAPIKATKRLGRAYLDVFFDLDCPHVDGGYVREEGEKIYIYIFSLLNTYRSSEKNNQIICYRRTIDKQ